MFSGLFLNSGLCIFEADYPYKVSPNKLDQADYNCLSDLFLAYLKTIAHLILKKY